MTDANREAIRIARLVVNCHVAAHVPDRTTLKTIFICELCQRGGPYEGTIYDFKHKPDCQVLLANAALDQIEKELENE